MQNIVSTRKTGGGKLIIQVEIDVRGHGESSGILGEWAFGNMSLVRTRISPLTGPG